MKKVDIAAVMNANSGRCLTTYHRKAELTSLYATSILGHICDKFKFRQIKCTKLLSMLLVAVFIISIFGEL